MSMENADQLLRLMEEETKVLELFLPLLESKREAAAKLDTKDIDKIVRNELALINRFRTLEVERRELLGKLGVDPNDLNKLKAELGSDMVKTYVEVQKTFREKFDLVRNLNNVVMFLLNRAVVFIKQNINILTDGGTIKMVDRKA
ncbi:MAG: flagellar protein FlgN [Candidatus Kryptoniota bacterium]